MPRRPSIRRIPIHRTSRHDLVSEPPSPEPGSSAADLLLHLPDDAEGLPQATACKAIERARVDEVVGRLPGTHAGHLVFQPDSANVMKDSASASAESRSRLPTAPACRSRARVSGNDDSRPDRCVPGQVDRRQQAR